MVILRDYRDGDARDVGILIADTYAKHNLGFASSPAHLARLLGPFAHARSCEPQHREEIARTILAARVIVAESGGEIVGVLRGRRGRLHSLFVREDHHRHGIGRMLMNQFEVECRAQGAASITLAATLYAVPFYRAIGYRRSTGVRHGRSFAGEGLPYQPMKKLLGPAAHQVGAAGPSARGPAAP